MDSPSMNNKIVDFVNITNSSTTQAENYLKISEGDLGQALQLFFDTGGAELDAPAHSPNAGTHPESSIQTEINPRVGRDGDDFSVALDPSRPNSTIAPHAAYQEDDEAIARRLQEEFYSSAGGSANNDGGVRAPIARTTETLVGPEDDFLDRMQPRSRQSRGNFTGRPGIFNQRPPPAATWADPGSSTRHNLAAATGGASEQSSKHQTLAEMYRPPYEIMQHLSFDEARDQAKEDKKWILVNIQDSSIFDCQVLNRDIWKAKEVKDTIKENFLFLQYDRAGIDGQNYVRLYFPHAIDVLPTSTLNPFPVVAIVDPRTGEQVKVWSEAPKKPLEFVMQLHEFLERYSLGENARNPIQKKSKPKVDIDHMTEDEMVQMALRYSMDKDDKINDQNENDPDELTKIESHNQTTKHISADPIVSSPNNFDLQQTSKPQSAFDLISKHSKHTEPAIGAQGSTRIQIRLADGSRIVRRFMLSDAVRVIYEYVKADLLPEKAMKAGEMITDAVRSKPFELVSMGKNLIDSLDVSIEEAGLKMGTIMLEFAAND